MSVATFIGLDLAWKIEANHSGITVLKGDERGVKLEAVSDGACSSDSVVAFLNKHSSNSTVLAIDCSLIVANETGQRPCETAVGREFGRYHASCHTTNTRRLYWDTGPELVRTLAKSGFVHGWPLDRARGRHGKWLIEVYPHPAMVRLFRLEQIIGYKKGKVDDKKAGLHVLRGFLGRMEGLLESELLNELLGKNLAALKGESLKCYEDTLDAVFCAYLAWYCWRWGAERNEVFGTLEQGYIVVPKALAAP